MAQQPVPEYRKEMRRETLKKVAQLYLHYYQAIGTTFNQDDLKSQTLQQVQEMDRIAGQSRTEEEYKNIMFNQIQLFEKKLQNRSDGEAQKLDPLSMARIMVKSLPDLQTFASGVENLSSKDLPYLQRLIQFIKSIPESGPQINQPEQIKAVKVYYERLFLPIQDRIQNQQNQSQQAAAQAMGQPGLQQTPSQQMMQPMMQPGMQPGMQQPQYPYHPLQGYPSQPQMASPPISAAPSGLHSVSSMQQLTPQSSQQIAAQMQSSQPQLPQQVNPKLQSQSSRSGTKPRSPSSRQNQNQSQQMMAAQQHYSKPVPETPPQQYPQQIQQQMQQMQHAQQQMARQPQRQPEEKASNSDMLKQLFKKVYTDCAVFYSTPHPHHF